MVIFNQGDTEDRKGLINATLGDAYAGGIPVLFATYDLGVGLAQTAELQLRMFTDVVRERTQTHLAATHVLALLVAASIDLSRRTVATIRRGLFWAFFYNVVGIPLAAAGVLSPVFAGAAMALSSVSVITNALRLRRSKL